jgi:hypothetical protein
MWWWEFNHEEPIQEDLVAYEIWTGFLREREKMNQDKERQRQRARQRGGGAGGSSVKYQIPD